jgi:hypothetical protein
MAVKAALKPDVGMNIPLAGSLHTLGFGATGLSVNQCSASYMRRGC